MLVLKTGKANNHSLAYYLAQGARWDLNAGSIAESKLKELYPAMPVMFIKAVTQDESVSVSSFLSLFYLCLISHGPLFFLPWNDVLIINNSNKRQI